MLVAATSHVVPEPVARPAREALQREVAVNVCIAEILERLERAELRRGALAGALIQFAEISPQEKAAWVAGRAHLDQIAAEVPAYLIDTACSAPLTFQHAHGGAMRRG